MANHYKYTFNNLTDTYNFATKNNILYKVAFIVDQTFSSISGEEITNVFQLVLEKVTTGLEPFDAMVSKTIEEIVESFFITTENALMFVCSEDDKKGHLRYRIFDRWYQRSTFKSVVLKIDNVVCLKENPSPEEIIYTSFLIHKHNPNKERLIEIYQAIQKTLEEDK